MLEELNWPEKLFLIKAVNGGYLYWINSEDLKGLFCFLSREEAVNYTCALVRCPFEVICVEVSFDEARTIAQKSQDTACLTFSDGNVHYVR